MQLETTNQQITSMVQGRFGDIIQCLYNPTVPCFWYFCPFKESNVYSTACISSFNGHEILSHKTYFICDCGFRTNFLIDATRNNKSTNHLYGAGTFRWYYSMSIQFHSSMFLIFFPCIESNVYSTSCIEKLE